MVATLKIARVLLVFMNLRIVAFTHPRSMHIEFLGGGRTSTLSSNLVSSA